jgi:F0F1-type ATP synthase beta subunit
MEKGKIVEIIGPVLDVEFPTPYRASIAPEIDARNSSGRIHLVAEVSSTW